MYHVAAESQKAVDAPRREPTSYVPTGRLHAVRVRAVETRCGEPTQAIFDFPHIAWHDARMFGSPCIQCMRLLAIDHAPANDASQPLIPGGQPTPQGQADLLAIVAHALLHPVVAIATGAQMLVERGDELPDDLRVQLLRIISQRCGETAEMLADMVHGGRPELLAQLDALRPVEAP